MEVVIKGTAKEIADLLREVESRQESEKQNHEVVRSTSEHCDGVMLGACSHNHCEQCPNITREHQTYEDACREHISRACELGFDPLIGFPAPPGWIPEEVK